MYIALNNFCLGYTSLAMNFIIRSCLPPSTCLMQQPLSMVWLYPFKPCCWKETGLVAIGVICEAVITMARIMCAGESGKMHSGANMRLGVFMRICSVAR